MGNALGIYRQKKQNPTVTVTKDDNDDSSSDEYEEAEAEEQQTTAVISTAANPLTIDEDNNADVNHDNGIDFELDRPRSPNGLDGCWGTPEQRSPALCRYKYEQILALIDPRSPNQDISRTPIVVADEAKKKPVNNHLLKVNQSMNQLDSDGGSQLTTPDTTVGLAFDPRSPTHEFDRTPIGILQKESYRARANRFEANQHERRLQQQQEN